MHEIIFFISNKFLKKDFDSPSTTINVNQGSRYKSYNQDYLNPPQVSNFNQNAFTQPKQMNQFNNFDNSSRIMQQQPQSNYNNLNQPMMQMNQQQQQMMNKPVLPVQQKPKLNFQSMSLEDIGDFIYSYCEKLYPE